MAVSAGPIPKRQFLVEPSSLAHDLINDLTIIVGECDLLDDILQGEVGAQRLQVIRAAAQRMADRVACRPSLMKIETGSGR